MLKPKKEVISMKDQKKADEVAEQRVQIISPLLAEGLDPAQARQIKARICQQTGLSERTLRRYLSQYRKEGFSGLKPKVKDGEGKKQYRLTS
jgi:putative transposase